MTFQRVYDSLRDLFPMVNDQALRAVAIEHVNDVDAAIEAVSLLPLENLYEYAENDLDEYDEDEDEYDENDLDEYNENDLDEYDESDLDESNLSSTTTDSTSSEEHLIVLDESDISSSTDSASRGKNMSNPLGAEDETALNSSMCSQNCTNIDHLEEIIGDARNNKKTLFMEMESVINLMKQVEVKEHAAEQAKTEAARVEMDAQNEIKELKITIKHAKEANDMHAGDVCGEKVILTTELRDLHSRLVSLSNDRDKSLADLDEMRQCLEVRLAAAENEIRSAEAKKFVNEQCGKQSIIEQKLIIAQVVQESKNLRQQAEDNAKLHAFLVDRGQLVDTLQGEIAVICQDVKQLKEKFDQRLPLSRSLFSTQTSFLLASSKSSLKSSVPDQVEAVAVRDGDRMETGDHEKVPEDELAGVDSKALAEDDDGWVLFESSNVNACASSDDE
ncbi:kinesin-related protein 4-like [Salvia splendens]|uniref:kinesin-related protein 4-like n=1 Tax=Salvia splendens TaxID=180675 RepID=UPI001C27AABA|nr:kinesin-related protein 4-like [Salvia splendens]